MFSSSEFLTNGNPNLQLVNKNSDQSQQSQEEPLKSGAERESDFYLARFYDNNNRNYIVKSESDDCANESLYCTRCRSNSSGSSVSFSSSDLNSPYHLTSPMSAAFMNSTYSPLSVTSTGFQRSPSVSANGLLPEAAQFVTLPMSISAEQLHHQYNQNYGLINGDTSFNTGRAQHKHSGIGVQGFQIVPNLNNVPNPVTDNSYSSFIRNDTLVLPVDLVFQERAKLERKRARNRAAATKCRRRKMEKIESLQDQVNNIANKNGNLISAIDSCKNDIKYLRHLINIHEMRGCSVDLDMTFSAADFGRIVLSP